MSLSEQNSHTWGHGNRHRATTEIANSGVPVKVGMQLTGHKTVSQFMRYVHTENDRVQAAAETVASQRRALCSLQQTNIWRSIEDIRDEGR